MQLKRSAAILLITTTLFGALSSCQSNKSTKTGKNGDSTKIVAGSPADTLGLQIPRTPIDTADYNRRMLALSNHDTLGKWPAKGPYPLEGAILPYHRIVSFYGNLYSKRMGVLGEYPKDIMLKKLKQEVAHWQKADTSIPVIPALHYIAVTAQSNGGKQRMRMPFKQIDTIIKWANEVHGLVFLDVQVGWSTLQEEIPQFEKYLKMPNVHLGIDPEFSMKYGDLPGKRIGTYNADDINYVTNYLVNIVKANNIPPKILIVHRFTQGMVTNVAGIKKAPQVQIVMDMDGWGDKILKRSSYYLYEYKEPVQFTGFKLFYKNDIRKDPNGMLTPEEVLKLIPKPIYIQYQ
ncbi:MAG: hypothetical protein NVS3B19_02140 [Ginsengibacter sp.]